MSNAYLYHADVTDELVIESKGRFLKAGAPVCPRCKGYFTPACGCAHIREKTYHFNQTRIPSRFRHATMNSIRPQDATSTTLRRLYQWIRNWAEKQPLPTEGMLLSGPCGIGKTHAVATLLRFLAIERRISCRFLIWSQFLSDLKAAFNGQGSVYSCFNSIQDIQVLLIDDLNEGRGTMWEKQVFDEIISERYNAYRPTFMTTNHPIELKATSRTRTFEKWALPHTISRVFEMCDWFSLDGPNRRKRSSWKPSTIR